MSDWIFVMAGNKNEFLERVKKETWSIYSRTTNRNRIRKGDRVLFYLAGPHRQKIIASSILNSELKKEKEDFIVSLAEIEIWKKQVPIQSLIDLLEFIKNKTKWGVHMQGGIVSISKKDYVTITAEAK